MLIIVKCITLSLQSTALPLYNLPILLPPTLQPTYPTNIYPPNSFLTLQNTLLYNLPNLWPTHSSYTQPTLQPTDSTVYPLYCLPTLPTTHSTAYHHTPFHQQPNHHTTYRLYGLPTLQPEHHCLQTTANSNYCLFILVHTLPTIELPTYSLPRLQQTRF